MIIIAEKINGSIPSMQKAIAAHDEAWIKDIAKKESDVLDMDRDFIDCCTSVEEHELETMEWMIGLIQEVCDNKIAIDSPNPQISMHLRSGIYPIAVTMDANNNYLLDLKTNTFLI